MTRNEPSALQIVLDELRQLRSDVRIDVGAIRSDLGAIHKRAEDAHDEIEKYKNRAIGFGAALGVGGGGVGAMLAKYWPTLFS
jgi:hypothetical protein